MIKKLVVCDETGQAFFERLGRELFTILPRMTLMRHLSLTGHSHYYNFNEEEGEKDRALSMEEEDALSVQCNIWRNSDSRENHNKAFLVDFALCTGLRVQEMADLTVADLDFVDRSVSVDLKGFRGDKIRMVWGKGIVRRAQDFLWKWNASGDANRPVFCSERGSGFSRNGLQKKFKRICQLAGLNESLSIHCLRHTFNRKLTQQARKMEILIEWKEEPTFILTEKLMRFLGGYEKHISPEVIEMMYGNQENYDAVCRALVDKMVVGSLT
jgi:integrase